MSHFAYDLLYSYNFQAQLPFFMCVYACVCHLLFSQYADEICITCHLSSKIAFRIDEVI